MSLSAMSNASSTGRPLSIAMERAWTSRALFSFRESPLSPQRFCQVVITLSRKDSTPAKSTRNRTARASRAQSTGIAPSNQRPMVSKPPATPVSREPREA